MNSSEVFAQCLQSGEHSLQTSGRPCEVYTDQDVIHLTSIPTTQKDLRMPLDAPSKQCDLAVLGGSYWFCPDCGLCLVIQSLWWLRLRQLDWIWNHLEDCRGMSMVCLWGHFHRRGRQHGKSSLNMSLTIPWAKCLGKKKKPVVGEGTKKSH